LVASDVGAGTLVDATTQAGQGMVESTRVFDEFKEESLGEGMRAIAIRYRLRAPDRTLQGTEIASIREAMIAAAANRGARLRGA
jgi:phenylalanyl-tRNA synthetase beta chain